MHLGNMTSAAFAAAATSNPVVLLPLGSQEDHGPFLPMGDYLLAETLALRIAAAANAAGTVTFVAPALPFGVADYFGASPGGLAISAASFRGLLTDVLDSLLSHGLTNIVILNGHGGNVQTIHDVTLNIRRRHDVVIPSFYLWKIAKGLMQAPSEPSRFGHGGEPLLSLSLALRPDHVDLAAATAPVSAKMLGLPVSGFGAVAFQGAEIDAPAEFDQVPRPWLAAAHPSAERGRSVADALVALATDFVVYLKTSAAITRKI